MPAPLRILYLISLLSTIICGSVYIATFFGYADLSVIWFVLFLFILWPMVVWQWRRVPRCNLVSEIFGQVPLWMKITTVALILFIFINYLVNSSLIYGAQPIKLDDERLVLRKGELILRVLTPGEYAWAQAVQMRILAGHLVAFYGLAVIALRAFWIKTGPAMADAKVTGN
ncbi:MAG: hypothetical protein WC378_09795 [Opitutaceae bacterium]|jgi:hypothetical protein